MAAPSAMANPSRVRSKGRGACSGSSLRRVVALIASKHATAIGVTGASVAPATITSALPSWMSWQAWPRASMPEVQPAEMTDTGPSAPAAQAISRAREPGTK